MSEKNPRNERLLHPDDNRFNGDKFNGKINWEQPHIDGNVNNDKINVINKHNKNNERVGK